jgi:hypothetical protein
MATLTLAQRIIANSPTKHVAILSESVMFKDKDIIPIDVPIINVAFSGTLDGGLSSGLTLLAGPSKSFKTCLALLCTKSYLDKYKDAVCIYYDSEGGSTPAYLKSMGVDPTRVVHIPIEHMEMLKFDLVRQLKELNRGDKVIIVIDSIGNTASLGELENALEEKTKAEMQRAKSIKGLFRMVTPSLVTKDIPCLTICHTYSEMTLYPKQIISGGCLVAGTKVTMFDGSFKSVEDVLVGDLVQTLEGAKPVTNVWNPNTLENGTPECLELTFDDGFKVVCSETHPFLTTTGWITASKLTPDHDIVSLSV